MHFYYYVRHVRHARHVRHVRHVRNVCNVHNVCNVLQIMLAITSLRGVHLGVHFGSLDQLADGEQFTESSIQLRTRKGVFCTFAVHGAYQTRWTEEHLQGERILLQERRSFAEVHSPHIHPPFLRSPFCLLPSPPSPESKMEREGEVLHFFGQER